MNLILQGSNPAAIDRIATLAHARRIAPINAAAWRCEGVNHSPESKEAIDAARVLQLIQRNKHYQLAGPDKLKVSADLFAVAERVARTKSLFGELAGAPAKVQA